VILGNRILRISLTLYLQCVSALEIAFRRSVSTVNESTIVITMVLSLLFSQCFKMLFVFLTGVSGSLLTFRFILKQTSMFKHFLKHSETFFSQQFYCNVLSEKKNKAYTFIMLSLHVFACQFFQPLDQVVHYSSCSQ
jgi:hypothetical protein